MKTFKLPVYGIIVKIRKLGLGTISSDMKEDCDENEDVELIAAIDAIESIILAHACAGIDISSPQYVKGIETSVETIFNIHS
jgi:hypothetical protein